MYVHAGDTIHLVLSVSSGVMATFGTDLQARLQSANVQVLSINDNAVPVSSGWSFGPLIIDVVPRIDFADIGHIAQLAEGAASAAGFYVEWGTAQAQLVATAGQGTQNYQQLQNSPPANSPPPGTVPDLKDLFGFGSLSSETLLVGGVVVAAVVVAVLLSRRR